MGTLLQLAEAAPEIVRSVLRDNKVSEVNAGSMTDGWFGLGCSLRS